MRRKVDNYQVELTRYKLPLYDQVVVRSWILRPGRTRLQHLPFAAPDRSALERGQKFFIHFGDIRLDRLIWPASQLHRSSKPGADKLTLVQQAQSRQAKDGKSGGSMLGEIENRRDPRFVMIFQKVGAGVDEFR